MPCIGVTLLLRVHKFLIAKFIAESHSGVGPVCFLFGNTEVQMHWWLWKLLQGRHRPVMFDLCKSFLSWSSRHGHKQILHLSVGDLCLSSRSFLLTSREVANCRFHQQHEQQQQQQRQRCSYSDGICNGRCFTIHQQGRLSTVVFFPEPFTF